MSSQDSRRCATKTWKKQLQCHFRVHAMAPVKRKHADPKANIPDTPNIPEGGDLVAKFEDGELVLHSQVLAMASPVFKAMLSTDMKEAASKRIDIEIATVEGFKEFYAFLTPGPSRKVKVSGKNVEQLLEISAYYQVEFLRDECENFLLGTPGSVNSLLLASKYNVEKLYRHCLSSCHKWMESSLKPLEAHPKILMDVASRLLREFAALRDCIEEELKRRASTS